MRVLFDTNVILDVIADREPFSDNAKKIVNLILENKLEGFITASSTTDIFYIARKYLDKDKLHAAMKSLFSLFGIIDILNTDCLRALDLPMNDYEDALLAVCCNKINADYIITRDEEFINQAGSSLKVVSPAKFLKDIL